MESVKLKQPGKNELSDIKLTNTPDEVSSAERDKLELERINMFLLLKDQMLISEASYHELSQISPDLPRSYKIRRQMAELNATASVQYLDGPIRGAFLSFPKELEKRVRLLQLSDSYALTNRQVNIRLSLDGTRIGDAPGLVMGFEILKDTLASNSLRLLAIGICGESYEEIRCAFAKTIEELEKTTSIMVDGINVTC